MIKNFKDLWKAHTKWQQGVLIKKIKLLKTADVYFGYSSDEWYNFALPKVEKPNDLDLVEIKKTLSSITPAASIYLWEKHIKADFPQFLTQNGYKLLTKDTWMVFNHAFRDLETEIPVEHIGLEKFPDYKEVTVKVYGEDWDYNNKPYLEICRQSLTGEKKSKAPGFLAEFFMVYVDGQPTAGAGLFLTKEVAWFHNDATFKEYRKRGYHTALIKERIKFCLDRDIKTLYAFVEYGNQSFRNFKRCGFKPWQVCELFTLK